MKKNTNFLLPLLMFLSILSLIIIIAGIGKISYLGLREISVGLPTFFLGICIIVFTILIIILLDLILIVSPLAKFSFGHKYIYQSVNLLFPFILLWGRILKISRRNIEKSFITLNNTLMKYRSLRVHPNELLVISPHCLQLAACQYKITYDINNCHQCGRCTIGAMLKMAREIGFNFEVVTGGTLARKLVREMHPKLVLAIACERDLTSGIQDVYPLPAVGVLNIRPNGPCFNTTVDLKQVRTMIEKFIIKNEDTTQ